MGEAKNKKEAHIEELLKRAIALNLSGVEDLFDISVAELARSYNGHGSEWWLPSIAELARSYNGCGPEWLPSAVREKLTEYFAIFEPAFMIHDWRFSRSDGTSSCFNFANFELEQNLRRIAKAKYGFFNWRRYRALAAAKIIVGACDRFGWSAYIAAAKTAVFALAALAFTGCYRSIELVREGEYTLSYTAVGLKTDVDTIEAEKTTNGVRVFIKGVATDVSERNAKIIESSGTAVGNIAEKVVEGMK